MLRVLKYAYPDVTRINAVPHPGKNFVPDFTSRSAQCAAEYKFVKNNMQLTQAYDAIAVDMAGYSRDPEIRSKFALIYLDSPSEANDEILRLAAKSMVAR